MTADLATGPPFVRNPLDVDRAMRCVLVAATPCAGMALYNTGFQANRAFATGISPSGWRTQVVAVLGLGHSPTSAVDCVVLGALFFVPLWLVAWGAARVAEACFARARGRPADPIALSVLALLFSLSVPATLPVWQAALGAAVGVVVGRELFGGFGRNIANPVVVGLAFLFFAYPGALSGDAIWVPVPGYEGPGVLSVANRFGMAGIEREWSWAAAALGWTPGGMGETSALACLLGLSILLYSGVASWRIVAGGCLGLLAGVWAIQGFAALRPIAELPWHWHLVSGSFAFGLVFLATDPVTAAATDLGRWFYGAIIGALVAVLRVANPAYQEGVLLALLFGNVSAPLIDRLVASAQFRWHRGTGGR